VPAVKTTNGFDAVPLGEMSKERGVYDQLRRAIISGALRPGQRLIPAEVGARFGVSSMPVRNALMRLEAERLVTRAPHREFAVTTYSAQEIKDLYVIRVTLDGLAARLGAQNTTPEVLAELREVLRRSERYLAQGDTESLMEANREFHETIYRQVGNRQLLELVQAMRDRANRYRAAYFAISDIPAHTVEEHREILAALERGDAQAVEALVKKGMEDTGAKIVEALEERTSP
jgi:DNA-binding GntR family transcriptional regulator